MGQADDPRAVSQHHAMSVCLECGRTTIQFERGWRAYLAVADTEQPAPPELLVYCPDCAEREFGSDETLFR